MKVKLKDIIDHIDMQSETRGSYVNLKTGEIISLSDEDLERLEDMDEYEINELPDWQQEELEEELEFLKHEEDYEALPRELDINSYRILEKFIFSLDDDEQVSVLQEAIQGKGAFSRFRNKAANLGLLEKWYQFRRECHQEIAIDWCEQKGITYE